MISAYYRGASGLMLVYSVMDRSSFENALSWLKVPRSQMFHRTFLHVFDSALRAMLRKAGGGQVLLGPGGRQGPGRQ